MGNAWGANYALYSRLDDGGWQWGGCFVKYWFDFATDGDYLTLDMTVQTQVGSEVEDETTLEVARIHAPVVTAPSFADISITGSFTIELNAVHLWGTYESEGAEHAYGQTPEEATGYPCYPYYDENQVQTWAEGEMSGSEMSVLNYGWKFDDTSVTIDGSFTIGETTLSFTDTGSIASGDVPLGLDFDLMQRQAPNNGFYGQGSYAGKDLPAGFKSVVTGFGTSLPMMFGDLNHVMNGSWTDGLGFHSVDEEVVGTDDGDISVVVREFEDPSVSLSTTADGIVYPRLDVVANGRVNPIGSSAWPDNAEYPAVKIRPLWKYYNDYDMDSYSLSAGSYIGNLDLRKSDIDITMSPYSVDNQPVTGSFTHKVDEFNLGVVLDPSFLVDAKQHSGSWRVMSQDAWLTKPCKVKHKESGTPPESYINLTNWNLTNGTGTGNIPENGDLRVVASGVQAKLEKTFVEVVDEWSFSEYRYLQFSASGATSFDLTLKITFDVGLLNTDNPRAWEWTEHTKSWTLPVTTDVSLLEADLVAPDATSESRDEYDTTTWAHDLRIYNDPPDDTRSPGQVEPNDDGTDDEMDFVPNHLFGVGRVKKVEILIPAGKTVYFLGGSETPFRLHTKYFAAANEVDRAMITVLPVFQLSNSQEAQPRWTYYDTFDQIWVLDPDWWKFHPEGKRLVSALVNYKQSLDLPYARCLEGAYRCTAFPLLADILNWWLKNGSQDWELTDVYDTDAENPNRLNAAYPSLALSPCKWDGSTCTPIRDIDVYTAEYELEARLPCDIITVAPGTGDPQSTVTSYPYYFYTELGARFQGITHKINTYKALPFATVKVDRGVTNVASYTSNRWAYWKSDPLHTLGTEDHHTVKYEGMSAPVDMVAWARRYQWVSLLGVAAASNGGVSYDVGLDSRHYRAYIKNGTIWLGISTNVKPLAFTDTDLTISATDVTIRIDRDKPEPRIYLNYIDGTCKTVYSTNEGTTWSTPVTIASAGTHSTFEITRDGRRLAYWVDGTAIKGKIYDARDNVMVDTFTAIASGVDDQSIDASESISSGGIWGVDLLYIASGAVTVKHSTDGQTFS
jgi:hypothetical protein